MKKIGIITLFALAAVLFLMGCKQPTNAETWTELTAENIEAEIAKYDGTFKNDEETYFIVIDSQKSKIGYGESENQAYVGMLAVTDFLANPNNKLSGSAKNKLTITIDGSKYTCSKLPAETWTELTEDNILSEIEKYDGSFIGEAEVDINNDGKKEKVNFILIINAKEKTMGSGENEEQASNMVPALEAMEFFVIRGLHLFVNGGSRMKFIDTALNIGLILTKQ